MAKEKTWREERYEALDAFLEKCDKYDKKFLLWQLLKEHEENLERIMKEKPEPKTAKDVYETITMDRHKSVAMEMCYVLVAELF